MEFPEPTDEVGSRAEVLLRYLDFFRETVIDKVLGMPESRRRSSLLPSGWSPIELLVHLAHVERRWLVWGFEGCDVGDPWGDWRDGRWHSESGITTDEVVADLREQGRTTRAVVGRHELDERGMPGERWADKPPAQLERVLLHLLQEHARHAGHLDIVRELVDGKTGE